jgi:alkylation response protein AidB-like acyl-CoA dehydrogenase
MGQVQEFLNARRIFVVCAMPGLMQTALEDLVHFLKKRFRHESPLTDAQIVQANLGEMYAAASTARAVLHNAIERIGRGDAEAVFDPIVTAAKYTIVELAIRFAEIAIRLTGWLGYSKQLPYERHLRSIFGGVAGQTPQEVLRVMLGTHVVAQVENSSLLRR